ncbi:MAG: hypothetical protein ACPGKS_02035 [Coraliomargarita sp.]
MKRVLVIEANNEGHKGFYLALVLKALQPHHAITLMAPDWPENFIHQFEEQGVDINRIERFPLPSSRPEAILEHTLDPRIKSQFDRFFIPFLDSFISPALNHLDRLPKLSGIWFHPHALDRRYAWFPPIDKRLRYRRRIHSRLQSFQASQTIEHLFFLTEETIDACKRVNQSIGSSLLPDPPEKKPALNRTEARLKFGIPQDRVVFLHAGTSDRRKGLSETITAYSQLIKDPEIAEKVLLVRIGKNHKLGARDSRRLIRLEKTGSAIVNDSFLSSEDFLNYFSAASWVLLPYLKFRFSSGILSNAIHANRRVIASNYGAIGSAVAQHELGMLYRHSSHRDYLAKLRASVQNGHCPESTRELRSSSQQEFIEGIRAALHRADAPPASTQRLKLALE